MSNKRGPASDSVELPPTKHSTASESSFFDLLPVDVRAFTAQLLIKERCSEAASEVRDLKTTYLAEYASIGQVENLLNHALYQDDLFESFVKSALERKCAAFEVQLRRIIRKLRDETDWNGLLSSLRLDPAISPTAKSLMVFMDSEIAEIEDFSTFLESQYIEVDVRTK